MVKSQQSLTYRVSTMFETNEYLQHQSEPVAPQQVVRMLFFNELVRAGSITKASDALNVSVSTGSRWLSELEEELGIPLYRRNDKDKRITDAGDYLYKKISLINTNIQHLTNELSQFTTVKKGNVRICCTPVYAEKILLPIMYEFLDDYPEINIQLTINPYGLDAHKDYDFIISAIAGSAVAKDTDLQLVKRNLMSEKFILVAAPSYLRRWGEPLIPEDLIVHRCLYAKALYNKNRWMFKQGEQVKMISIPPTIELSDANILTRAVVDGIGISYLPAFSVAKHIQNGELIRLLGEYETDDWLLNIYYPPQKSLPGSTRVFKEHLLSKHRENLDKFKAS